MDDERYAWTAEYACYLKELGTSYAYVTMYKCSDCGKEFGVTCSIRWCPCCGSFDVTDRS